jgi:hypothetical protein
VKWLGSGQGEYQVHSRHLQSQHYDLYKQELQQRAVERSTLKLCMVTIFVSMLTLVSATIGKYASSGDKTYSKIRKLFKYSARVMTAAIVLMFFWQLPSLLRVVDSMNLNELDQVEPQRQQSELPKSDKPQWMGHFDIQD